MMDFMETNHCRPSKYNDDNRDYCKENGIQTSFVKRGRPFSEERRREKTLSERNLPG